MTPRLNTLESLLVRAGRIPSFLLGITLPSTACYHTVNIDIASGEASTFHDQDSTDSGLIPGTTIDLDTFGTGPETSSTANPGVCGDNVVSDGEKCDDGNAVNTDNCLDSCVWATCGDGFVWEHNEECDDGNNEHMSDDCGHCSWNPRLVFATSKRFFGDLSTLEHDDEEPPGAGLAKADRWCQQLADNVSLPGKYRAWLSTKFAGPATRFDNVEHNADTVPYHDVQGNVVADSWSALTSGICQGGGACLGTSILVDENKMPITSNRAWSFTTVTGHPEIEYPSDCTGWTDVLTQVHGRAGIPSKTNSEWTSGAWRFCTSRAHLYCFKQASPSVQ